MDIYIVTCKDQGSLKDALEVPGNSILMQIVLFFTWRPEDLFHMKTYLLSMNVLSYYNTLTCEKNHVRYNDELNYVWCCLKTSCNLHWCLANALMYQLTNENMKYVNVTWNLIFRSIKLDNRKLTYWPVPMLMILFNIYNCFVFCKLQFWQF